MLTSALLLLACQLQQKAHTFASRSGEFQLEVEKSEEGAFLWRLHRSDEVLWEEIRPHAATEAFLCADRTVVAYGIDHPEAKWTEQACVLTILGSDGAVRLLELHPFRGFITEGFGPYPRAKGVLVWETLDTCAFWIHDVGEADTLLTFTLSSGARQGRLEPDQILARATDIERGKLRLRSARAPGGSELLLTAHTDGQRGLVALMDVHGRLIWHDELSHGRFFGEIREIEGSADEFRCRLDIEEIQTDPRFVAPGRPVRVDMLALHFRRDESGSWHQE